MELVDTAQSEIDLDRLDEAVPMLAPLWLSALAESCAYCLDSNGHASGIFLPIKHSEEDCVLGVTWSYVIGEQQHRTYTDRKQLVDDAAMALAVAIAPRLTGLMITGRSAGGDRVDFYLTNPDEDTLIFNSGFGLEATGIDSETHTNNIKYRINRKTKRFTAKRVRVCKSDHTSTWSSFDHQSRSLHSGDDSEEIARSGDAPGAASHSSTRSWGYWRRQGELCGSFAIRGRGSPIGSEC